MSESDGIGDRVSRLMAAFDQKRKGEPHIISCCRWMPHQRQECWDPCRYYVL